jgi:hypothetical protein
MNRLCLLFCISFFSTACLSTNSANYERLQQAIVFGNAPEIEILLNSTELSVEQEENIKNLLYHHSYVASNITLSKLFDLFFSPPHYANDVALLFNTLCSNDFVKNPAVNEFVSWYWAEKVRLELSTKMNIGHFFNDCIEESLKKNNYYSLLWLSTEDSKDIDIDLSVENKGRIERRIKDLKIVETSLLVTKEFKGHP